MNTSPIKIQRGMKRQIALWRETVASRQQRLGWKIGFNMAADQQRLNLPSAMVGFLSGEHLLTPGGSYQAPTNARLLIEPEVAILIGNDLSAGATEAQAKSAIAAYAAALELVDTTRSAGDDIEEVLAGNLFHDSVLLATQRLPASAFCREQLSLSLSINNREVRTLEEERVPQDFTALILTVAHILATHGEQLKEGDWVITGAAAKPVPVQPGESIRLDMGVLGQTSLTLT